jgi:putative restriction endonuclease
VNTNRILIVVLPNQDSGPDRHPEVSNGLSLCKIHRAAFDRGIIGIRPDYAIEVREDALKEVDGPMKIRLGRSRF